MKKLLITGMLTVGASLTWGQYLQAPIIKTSKLGPTAVLITCLNGADPTGNKLDNSPQNNVLIVSCTPRKTK